MRGVAPAIGYTVHLLADPMDRFKGRQQREICRSFRVVLDPETNCLRGFLRLSLTAFSVKSRTITCEEREKTSCSTHPEASDAWFPAHRPRPRFPARRAEGTVLQSGSFRRRSAHETGTVKGGFTGVGRFSRISGNWCWKNNSSILEPGYSCSGFPGVR